MTITKEADAFGEQYTATCDECGDEIATGDTFAEAVDRLKDDGARPRLESRKGVLGVRWYHYCEACLDDMEG